METWHADDNVAQSRFDVSNSNQEHHEIIPLEINEGYLIPGGNQKSSFI
jgi:hypothetical protein